MFSELLAGSGSDWFCHIDINSKGLPSKGVEIGGARLGSRVLGEFGVGLASFGWFGKGWGCGGLDTAVEVSWMNAT